MKKSLSLTTTVILASLYFNNANAAITSYSDRSTFDIAAGVTNVEDFESFATQTQFRTQTVDIGDFSLSTTSAPSSTLYNFLDIAPSATFESDVNGTNDLRVFTVAGSSFFINFDSAISSFGADLRNFNDSITRTDVFLDGVLAFHGISPSLSFLGLISDSLFSSVEFRGLTNDVFGIDNVTYNTVNAIPVPAAAFLFAPALLGFMGLRRKAKATIA